MSIPKASALTNILVTGGAGYIGSHTLVALLNAGYDVCAIDNFTNSSPSSLQSVSTITRRHFSQHRLDIRSSICLNRVFDEFKPEAVIHFAGLKAVGASAQHPLEYYDVNVGGTVRLLNAMAQVGCKRIVFSSSATVYGEPQYTPIDENHPCAPTNPYGRTKLMAEQILTDWQKANPSAGVVLLRYFNPVGAHSSGLIGEEPPGLPNNLMPTIGQVATGKLPHVKIFGNDYPTKDGTGIRDYIHVEDLAGAHLAALGFVASSLAVHTFNIGTGAGLSVLGLISSYEQASKQRIPVVYGARRKGDIAACVADPGLANASLKWSARYSVAEMCSSAWKWHSSNRDSFQNI